MSLRGPQWFSVVLFCRYWVSTIINTFMVYACGSCTRVKLVINEQMFFRCFSISEKATLNFCFSSSSFSSFRALVLVPSFLLCSLLFLSLFFCYYLFFVSDLLSSTEVPPDCLNVTECHAISSLFPCWSVIIAETASGESPELLVDVQGDSWDWREALALAGWLLQLEGEWLSRSLFGAHNRLNEGACGEGRNTSHSFAFDRRSKER